MKRLLIGILIIIFIAVISFFVDFIFGLSTDYNYLTAKKDISKGHIQLISYGLPLFDVNPISTKYGFKNIEHGCTATKKEINGIKYYNSTMKTYLTKINGKDWEIKYQNAIDSLYKLLFDNKK